MCDFTSYKQSSIHFFFKLENELRSKHRRIMSFYLNPLTPEPFGQKCVFGHFGGFQAGYRPN